MEHKAKKTIKWFTYVDEDLDARFQNFMKEFNLSNQAKAIRTCIASFLSYVDLIKLKKVDLQECVGREIDRFIERAIYNYSVPGQNFLSGLKQRLSPLKTTLLMCTQVQENSERLRKNLNIAEKALQEIETYLQTVSEEPSPRRFINTIDILHVEDNELERRTISDYFEMQNKKITSVERAEDALEVLKTVTPKVMLFDVSLPTSFMNGDKLCKMLKSNEEYRLIPICLMTAIIPPNEKEALMKETGADEIIFKPIKSLANLDFLLKIH